MEEWCTHCSDITSTRCGREIVKSSSTAGQRLGCSSEVRLSILEFVDSLTSLTSAGGMVAMHLSLVAPPCYLVLHILPIIQYLLPGSLVGICICQGVND